MIMGNTSLLGISTLTSRVNFYTRLMRLKDPLTGMPMFTDISIELACKQCIEDGKASDCVHMLHLVPRYMPALPVDASLRPVLRVDASLRPAPPVDASLRPERPAGRARLASDAPGRARGAREAPR